MNDRLFRAFDAVRSQPQRQERLRAYLEQQTRSAASTRSRAKSPRLIPVLACLVLLAAGVAGGGLYFTPVSVISVDVNPSVELSVNRFDRVISVEGQNEDGQALAQDLDLAFLTYSDAVTTLVDSPTVSQYLAQDEVLSLAVISSDQDRAQEMLAVLRTCTQNSPNTYCTWATMEEVADAHNAGLSYGKYRIFLQIQALDPQLTSQDVQGMTMRELRDLLQQLTSSDKPSSGNGQGYGPGPGWGQGTGQGQAWGYGWGRSNDPS